MPRQRRCLRRIRWPWLWPLAILLAAIQLAAFSHNWTESVTFLAPVVAGLWMGCCCVGGDCGPCCRDRGCLSELVEYRITGCGGTCGDNFEYTCSTNCPILPEAWTTMTNSDVEPQCSWFHDPVCTEGRAEYGTLTGVTLRFSKKRFSCGDGSYTNSASCVLTMIVTGDSTTSGFGGGAWIAIWEKIIPGPYPTDCEGLHTLLYKCTGGFVPCDFSGTSIEVNLVFNGACDPTATFDPWTDDVNWEIESDCPEIDGDTDVLNNVSTDFIQQWEKDNVGVAGVLDVDADLVWSPGLCAYRLTLTQGDSATSCRLVGGTQTVTGTIVSCDPFELLFEGFTLEDDPTNGPCECGSPAEFDVRITE